MNKAKRESTMTLRESQAILGDKLSFAASEAYKLLRTNLSFSLPSENGCKVIGVTSSIRGEGKSTTAINLAYTVAQTGKNVLLMEADLRLPNIAKRLRLHQRPGISNMLVGQCNGADILQKTSLIDNLTVIAAGDIPPNPAELLGSEQMATVIHSLAKSFDVIIIDLPPVTAVSDAMIMSRLVSGMVVVVRQNYCEKPALTETMRQLKFAEAKVLGFVMTGANTQEKNYKRYGNSGYGYGEDQKEAR